jgi:hypothetical protein
MTSRLSAFLAGLVLAGSLAALAVAEPSDGQDDYELLVAGQPPICAKSRDTCEAARTAIVRGWLADMKQDAPTICRPHPNCFSKESNCIRNFNC